MGKTVEHEISATITMRAQAEALTEQQRTAKLEEQCTAHEELYDR